MACAQEEPVFYPLSLNLYSVLAMNALKFSRFLSNKAGQVSRQMMDAIPTQVSCNIARHMLTPAIQANCTAANTSVPARKGQNP